MQLHLSAEAAFAQRAQGSDGVADERERPSHIARDPERDGRQRLAAVSAALQFLIREVAERQEQALAHPRAELLVRVPIGDFLPRIHQRRVGRDGVHVFPEARIRGKQVDLLIAGTLREQQNLLISVRAAGADRHLPRRPKETAHVGMHERDSEPTA